jgi:hypothetical protein
VPVAGTNQLPVPYEVLVAQLAACADLLELLRTELDAPQIRLSIEELEAAQLRMLAALADCESADRLS